MASKRKLNAVSTVEEEPIDPSDELMFLCLGGGNEVGRSCHIIQYKGKTVMLDAGMHPAYDGLAAMPFYDEFDLGTVDVLLVSHFHIDHAASLPYVLAKTPFRGRVFMTHATKAIYKWLIQDSVRVSSLGSSNAENPPTRLYNEADHLSTFPKIEAIDYYTTHTHAGVRITPLPAGHVLGAAMFIIEIAGLNILFTGDYSREEDRHLITASVPSNVKIDVLITESTYGIASHTPRLEREALLMKSITSILNRGGRALLPVFALGRAQELLLILEEYWQKHSEYQKYPIYYASNLARKCMVVYQTYIGAMNENIRSRFKARIANAEASNSDSAIATAGPWDFRFIRSLKSLERFEDVGGCVMLASPGMMQSGVSRELLERWAPDPRNGVVITGYSVEGTMAKLIMQEPESITAIMTKGAARMGMGAGAVGKPEAVLIPRRCSVAEYAFAAHVDGVENREFIEEVAAPVVILVHGEKHNMIRLRSKLLSLNDSKPPHLRTKVFSPANCDELRIPFRMTKTAEVVGNLANLTPSLAFRGKRDQGQDGEVADEKSQVKPESEEEEKLITGVLIQNDFKLSLMAPEDLQGYAGLTTTTITCRERLTLSTASPDLILWALEGAFGTIKISHAPHLNGRVKAETNGRHEEADEEVKRDTVFTVMDEVTVSCGPRGEVEVEWKGSVLNDGIADAVLAVLLTVESSPAAVKHSSKLHAHDHNAHNPHQPTSPAIRLSHLCMFLESQFGSTITPLVRPKPSPVKQSPTDSDALTSTLASSLSYTDPNIELTGEEKSEVERLHGLGIPVPGLEVRVDKHVARIWLETLEIECDYAVLRDRVRAVVERAVECVVPVWG